MVFQPNDLPTNKSEFLCWFNYLPLFSFQHRFPLAKWCLGAKNSSSFLLPKFPPPVLPNSKNSARWQDRKLARCKDSSRSLKFHVTHPPCPVAPKCAAGSSPHFHPLLIAFLPLKMFAWTITVLLYHFTLSPLFLSPSTLTLQSGRSLYFKKLSVAPNTYSLNSLAELTRLSGPHLSPTSMFISIFIFPNFSFSFLPLSLLLPVYGISFPFHPVKSS